MVHICFVGIENIAYVPNFRVRFEVSRLRQVSRDLLLAFAGPAALERGFVQPEEVASDGLPWYRGPLTGMFMKYVCVYVCMYIYIYGWRLRHLIRGLLSGIRCLPFVGFWAPI